jgi:hypothetical protein
MSMGPSEINMDGVWLPDACTLPTGERPLRVAEFDDLSTGAVRGTELVGADRLRLDLQADSRIAGRAAELAAAETACHSFFAFTLTHHRWWPGAGGRHRHIGSPDTDLAERAAVKLAEVEAKITNLTVIAATLRAALEAVVDPAGHTR